MPDKVTKSTLPREAGKHLGSSEAKTKGALDSISRFVRTVESDDDENLIDIKVNNPFKRIIELLKDIRRKQSTTFSLKFTIPLIALPVFLLTAFQIGRFQTGCTPTIVTKIGTVKNITIDVPNEKVDLVASVLSFFRTVPKVRTGVPLVAKERALLISPQGETLTILHTDEIGLGPLEGRTVFLTGSYSSCSPVIALDSKQNITVLQ